MLIDPFYMYIAHYIDSNHITQRKETINHQWEHLRELTDTRTITLETAKKIHTFNRDANDTVQQIKVHIHTNFAKQPKCINTLKRQYCIMIEYKTIDTTSYVCTIQIKACLCIFVHN